MSSPSYEKIVIKRSKRKSLQLEVDRLGNIVLRCPLFCSGPQIDAFISKHAAWIERQMQKKKKARPLTQEEVDALYFMAKEYLPGRLKHFSALTGLNPQGLSITHAKTRYGSCSPKGRISLSCFLMQSPKEAIDYVLVHELCHLKHLNHGRDFYRLLESFLPDWKQRKKQLCPPGITAIS